jgi:uncharacterized protein
MSWSLVQLTQVPPAPWANGGGVTRELLAWPAPEDWMVRLSVAEIERNGPFSRLTGVRRWFAVLSGQGVKLRIGGAVHELETSSMPLKFDGSAQTDCELLGGPTRDFNLMVRQGAPRMERVRGTCSKSCRASSLIAVYASGHAASASWGSERLVIPPNTLAWRILDSAGVLQLAGEDALWMEIEP